jgi:hypothetical protein
VVPGAIQYPAIHIQEFIASLELDKIKFNPKNVFG